MIWLVLASAVLNILIGMIMETENIRSFIIFKATPFFVGLGALLYFVKEMNLI